MDFLKDYYNINVNIEVSFRKPKGKMFWGWIDLIGLQNKKYKIVVEHNISGLLGKIGHEMTHIKQYMEGDLRFTDDHKTFLWKGKEDLLIKDYNNINDFNEYKKVPWEAEAYHMQERLPKLFLKSKFLEDIKGKDANIDFLLDNDALN